MSTVEVTPGDIAASTSKRARALANHRIVMLVSAFVVLAAMSFTRIWTDQQALTSSQTIGTALRVMVPILMAGIAALWAERCGVLNIGIEGMMIFGTWFGGYFAWQHGAWVGLAMGVLGGMIAGTIHAVATVHFGVNQTISGVVMNIFAFYGARYLSDLLFVGEQGGGVSQSPPQKSAIPKFDVPFLAGGDLFGWKTPDIFGWFEDKEWFLVGDLGGIGRGLTYNISWATAIALATVPITAWVMWRTRFGLRLRSSGEAPSAAETLGVKVVRLRYAGLIISGGCAGFGGATMSIVASSYYRQGQTQGNGFIGMATLIFGNWRPMGVLGGASLFGYSLGIKLVANDSIPALFLFITFVAGCMLIVSLVRQKAVTAISAAVAGALFFYAYHTVQEVPESLTQALPYVITLVVLATASQRLRPPAMAGVPYRPGEGH
jgi:general nucleoside transport system permease protein